MVAELQVEIIGGDEFRAMLKGKNRKILQQVDMEVFRQAIFLSGEVMASIAGKREEKKSWKTGHFQRSVTPEKSGRMQATVSTAVPYSVYLEYGTSKIAPRYHFRNSLARNKDVIQREISKRIKAVVEGKS